MDHTHVRQTQPPAPAQIFYIGKNSRGHWVVQDKNHTCGGLFVDRAEAVRYAMFENGGKRQAVILVPDVLELDIGAPTKNDSGSIQRKAACS